MKVGEIIDRLNRKESLMLVANQLGMMPHLLSKKLRALGYEYDSERKKRVFVGEGEEPRERDISQDIPQSAPIETGQDYQKLMYEELCQIRVAIEICSQDTLPQSKRTTRRLSQEGRVRKSYTLPPPLLGRLERAAARRGVSKSQIIEEALLLFLEPEV